MKKYLKMIFIVAFLAQQPFSYAQFNFGPGPMDQLPERHLNEDSETAEESDFLEQFNFGPGPS